MSEKLPAVRPKELIRVLEQKGWRLDRVRGSHHIMVNDAERRALPGTRHVMSLRAMRQVVLVDPESPELTHLIVAEAWPQRPYAGARPRDCLSRQIREYVDPSWRERREGRDCRTSP